MWSTSGRCKSSREGARHPEKAGHCMSREDVPSHLLVNEIQLQYICVSICIGIRIEVTIVNQGGD